MSILKEYKEPKDLLEKSLREGDRTWKSEDLQEKSDHFFNFCVTSVSLRDWCIAYLNLDSVEQSNFYKMHSKNEWLDYCASIANLSKHFKLREGRKSSVLSVNSKVSTLVALGADGKIIEGLKKKRVSFDVQNSNSDIKNLMLVLINCLSQWEKIFSDYRIPAPNSDLKIRSFLEEYYSEDTE